MSAPNVRIIPAKSPNNEPQNQYRQLRVAAYCRVSTELEEQQNSYQVQIEYYMNLIHQNKEWSLAGIFADEGISGTQTKKRTEFNRMIRLCKQKKIDLILCKSISRFARNTVDCLEYVRQLKDIGIGIIFEKENINTLTMTSEFMIALYGSFAQAESESISKNITLGNQMAFREGKARYQYKYWLGYKKGSDGNPEIVDDEAETVRLIYRMFLNGDSMQKIAEFLIKSERKTALGKLDWNHITVKRILTNEKYTGDCILQKTYTLDCITHKQVRNNGERAMYLVSDAHPAIIDRDTFNLAQQEIARRTSKRKVSSKTTTEQGKYSSKYALTELLICGECGTPYRRCTWNVHGKKRIVWRCISRLDHGNRYCKNSPTMHEEPLHKAIVKAINDFYNCNEDVAEILKSNAESVLSGLADNEIQSIENQLKEIDEARNNFINLIATGTYGADSFDSEFAELFAEEEKLSSKLATLKSQNQLSESVENSVKEIENAEFQLEKFNDVIIRKLIECIKVLSKTEILIIFKGGYEVRISVEK
ncbi:MAG: recombinase family protein [Ruminococcus flavefaciens]|nr:recombinase family protein [Ruminococcus flavefaciens]